MFEKMMLKQLLKTSIRAVPATSKNKKLNLFSILWDTGGILRKYSGSNATGKCVNPVKKRREITYGITSVSKDRGTPENLLAWNRGHWSVENRNHRVRDVNTGQSQCP